MKQISNSKNLNFVLKPSNFVSELKKWKIKKLIQQIIVEMRDILC